MYKVGAIIGSFLPPHRGSINSIIHAATQCEKLYIIVFGREEDDKTAAIPLEERTAIILMELNLVYYYEIKVKGIYCHPSDKEKWLQEVKRVLPEKIDIVFNGDKYDENLPERLKIPVNSEQILANPIKHWEYILNSSKQFFAKQVLITGVRDSGKSYMTSFLAEIFNTSCNRGDLSFVDKKKATRFVYRDESSYEYEVCNNHLRDDEALKDCNKVCFFDTGRIIAPYLKGLYTNECNGVIKITADPNRYDIVLLLSPLKQNSNTMKEHNKLYGLYARNGFKDKIVVIDGNYNERLHQCIEAVDSLFKPYE